MVRMWFDDDFRNPPIFNDKGRADLRVIQNIPPAISPALACSQIAQHFCTLISDPNAQSCWTGWSGCDGFPAGQNCHPAFRPAKVYRKNAPIPIKGKACGTCFDPALTSHSLAHFAQIHSQFERPQPLAGWLNHSPDLPNIDRGDERHDGSQAAPKQSGPQHTDQPAWLDFGLWLASPSPSVRRWQYRWFAGVIHAVLPGQ